jgi:DNA-binding NarL/FixJ family response regulator
MILESHAGWEVVAEAADGKAAIMKAHETSPDVAIIDYSMPLMNGVEATRQIRKRNPNIEVLIFTMYDSEALFSEILEAGARAYLLKSDATEHLIAAIEALAMHKPFFSGQISGRLVESYLLTQKSRRGAVLSPRERIVVQLIAEGRTNKDIGQILNLSVKTIESHRAAALRKLNISSTAGLVRYAIRNNLVEP